MAATIKDVARLAGVSPSTVSRVLNQKGVISEETKQKIASAMEQLKYVPNDIARSFANGSAHAISLVIDISDGTAYANNFFNNTVFGIETAAHRNDYNLIITNGAAAFGGISSVERLIAGKKVAGVVLPISLVTDELLRRIEDLSVPCVILGRSEEVGAEANWVDINNVQAGRRAVKLLLERGYQKIAFLSDGDQEVFNQDRIAGYRRELAANHLSVPDGGILHGLPTVESGMDCVRAFLQGSDAPDAVICSDDRLALGALRAARQLGLRVPEQFGIISCDNTPLTELAETPITSVDVDTFALGVQAAQILIEQIEDPQTSLRQILLSTKLIERASTMRRKQEETEAITISIRRPSFTAPPRTTSTRVRAVRWSFSSSRHGRMRTKRSYGTGCATRRIRRRSDGSVCTCPYRTRCTITTAQRSAPAGSRHTPGTVST